MEEVENKYVFTRLPHGGWGIKDRDWISPGMFMIGGSEASLDEGRALTVALNSWHRSETLAHKSHNMATALRLA